jgi:hypothetical protein
VGRRAGDAVIEDIYGVNTHMDLIRARTWTSRPSVSADMATLGHSLRPGEGKSVYIFGPDEKLAKVWPQRGAPHIDAT